MTFLFYDECQDEVTIYRIELSILMGNTSDRAAPLGNEKIKQIKVISFGCHGVGKTVFLKVWSNHFPRGAGSKRKVVADFTHEAHDLQDFEREEKTKDLHVHICVHDTQESDKDARTKVIKECQGAIFFYDLTDQSTADKLSVFHQEIEGLELKCIIIGLKSELFEGIPDETRGSKFADEHGYAHFVSSAATSSCISIPFHYLAWLITDSVPLHTVSNRPKPKSARSHGSK
jgi:GTPase SAR1 family protein